MGNRLVTVGLALGVIVSLAITAREIADGGLPGSQIGYEPVQPITFSHRVHAGDLDISCVYCHWGVDRGRHAGIPAASLCMNCHRFVRSSFDVAEAERLAADEADRPIEPITSAELQPLYDALGLDEALRPDDQATTRPIEWIQVHDLADFVYFDHRPHRRAGVRCQECHGAVATMERVAQVQDLSMGWCIDCHRQSADRYRIDAVTPAAASINCSTCHF